MQNQCKLSAIELAQIAETQLGLSKSTYFLFMTAVRIYGTIIISSVVLYMFIFLLFLSKKIHSEIPLPPPV